ncbi:hypothetical protein KAR48_05270 [bacterium]|nr:hypothetical protein [bacterium]
MEKRKLTVVFILFILFTYLQIISAQTLYSDNFNTYADDQAITGWSNNGIYAENDDYQSSPMGARIQVDNQSYKTFTNTQGIIIAEIKMHPKLGSDTNNGFWLTNEAAASYAVLLFNKNSNDEWQYTQRHPTIPNTFVYVKITDYDNNWHNFKIVFNTIVNEYHLYMDGNLIAQNIDYHVDLSSGISRVGLNSGRGGGGTVSYFDDINIYVGSEPDWSLPVTLSLFSANQRADAILLNWISESEIDNIGYILERKATFDSNWEIVASYKTDTNLQSQGNTSSKVEYSFTDHDVILGNTYWYRLSDIDFEGNINIYDIIEIQSEGISTIDSYIEKPYPNPFNPITKFQYSLNEDKNIHLHIVDIQGRHVRKLYNGMQNRGVYNMYWDSMDDHDMKMPSGCYLIILEGESLFKSQKVLLVR